MTSNIGKENYFPLICLVSTSISFVFIYLFQHLWNLGVYSFIFGLTIQTSLQIVFQLILIIKYSPVNMFRPPKLRKILDNNGSMFKFILSYSLSFFLEYAAYELISFILLWSPTAEGDLVIWSSFAQLVNLVYFLGYAVGSFIRTIGTRLLGLEEARRFKVLVFKSSLFMTLMFLFFTLVVQFFLPQISKLFVSDPQQIQTFTKCFRLFSFFFVSEGFFIAMASTLRLLGHPGYVLLIMVVFFAASFPLSSFISVFVLHQGVFNCVVSLVICDTLVSIMLVSRYIYRLDLSVSSSISLIKRTHEDFLALQEPLQLSDPPLEENT